MDVIAAPSVAINRVPTARRHLRGKLYLLLLAVDVGSIFGGFLIASLVRDRNWLQPGGLNLNLVYLSVYLLFSLHVGAYAREALGDGDLSARKSLLAATSATAALLSVLFFSRQGAEVSRIALVSGVMTATTLMVTARIIVGRTVERKFGRVLFAQLVIVDGDDVRPHGDADVISAAACGISADLNDPYMLHRLSEIVGQYDRVIVFCSRDKHHDWALLLKGANVTGEIAAPGLREMGAISIAAYGNWDTYVVAHGPLSLPERAQKRLFDLVFTVPLLIGLLPLMLAVGVMIRVDSPGPVFFRQPRIGRGNRIFKIMKFRSMRVEGADSGGIRSTSRDDDRITRVGRLIRACSIDELPQMINVLLGDMSLVGPRPHALGSTAGDRLFWEVDRQYWHRHALKPGITGLAQVRGFRGATHHDIDLKNRLNADLEYLAKWSLLRDLGILFGTVKVLVHRNAF